MFESILLIISIILIGVFCEKRVTINYEQIEGLEIFLFKIALPAYLFVSIMNHDLETLLNVDYILSFLWVSILILSLSAIVFFKTNNMSRALMKTFAAGYINSAIFALPVISFLLNDPIAAVLSNLLQVILIQPIFIATFSFIKHREKSLLKKLFSILLSPLIIAPIIALVLNYLNIRLYAPIHVIIETLSRGATALALFTFGFHLGSIQVKKEIINRDFLYMVGIKNILHPVVALIIGKYIMHLPIYWLQSLIITSSAPTAFIVYLIAKQYGVESLLMKKVVAATSGISVLILVLLFSWTLG